MPRRSSGEIAQNRVQLCVGPLWRDSTEGLSNLSIDELMTVH